MWIGKASAVFDLVRNVTRDGSLRLLSPELIDFSELLLTVL